MLNKIQLLLLPIMVPSLVAAKSKLPFANSDFESGGLINWTAKGEAFESTPFERQSRVKDQRVHSTMQGDFCAHSGMHGDYRTGSLTSTVFVISLDYLSFRIAGGVHPGTRIEVLVKGKVVKNCSGIENWMLKANYFDLSEWRGQSAQIRFVDEVEASWGLILADDFQITDTRPNF